MILDIKSDWKYWFTKPQSSDMCNPELLKVFQRLTCPYDVFYIALIIEDSRNFSF